MAEESKWITPLLKQCLVVTGVSLNMASFGSVMGFNAILLPQLRAPGSTIPVDTSSESWIASIVGISLIFGNLVVPTIMGRFGRKKASLFSCLIILICWLWIATAADVTSILVARFLQGISLGINLSLSPIMIGEYTSPSNRGIYSSIVSSTITAATVAVHVIGSFITWQKTALVFGVISFLSFAILMFSPESPSWLADLGKFEECKKAYHWLRGLKEEAELNKMIEARKTRVGREKNRSVKDFIIYFSRSFKKKEFYKPVLLMIHLYTICMWTGMCFLIVYTIDTIHTIIGEEIDTAFHITVLDAQRMISTILGIICIKKFRRRFVLFTSVGINVFALLAIAAYTYARENGMLSFDHPSIGITLLHIHMFSITTGALPMPVIISGELFPLELRSFAGGISSLAFSLNYFITSKTAMSLLDSLGFSGTYILYAAITLYCLGYVWIFLPETKDRTLQDIEEEFKGVKREHKRVDEEAIQALATCDKEETL